MSNENPLEGDWLGGNESWQQEMEGFSALENLAGLATQNLEDPNEQQGQLFQEQPHHEDYKQNDLHIHDENIQEHIQDNRQEDLNLNEQLDEQMHDQMDIQMHEQMHDQIHDQIHNKMHEELQEQLQGDFHGDLPGDQLQELEQLHQDIDNNSLHTIQSDTHETILPNPSPNFDQVEPSPSTSIYPSPSPSNSALPSPSNYPIPSQSNSVLPSPSTSVFPSPSNSMFPSPSNSVLPSPLPSFIPSPSTSAPSSPLASNLNNIMQNINSMKPKTTPKSQVKKLSTPNPLLGDKRPPPPLNTPPLNPMKKAKLDQNVTPRSPGSGRPPLPAMKTPNSTLAFGSPSHPLLEKTPSLMDSNQASSVDAGLDTVPIDSANLTVEDLQDVTKYAGVDLQEESEKSLSKISESRIYPPEDPSLLKVNLVNLKKTVTELTKNKGLKHIREDVYELMANALQERIRNIIQDLILISRHRDESIKAKTRVEIVSNTKKQLQYLEKYEKEQERIYQEEMDQMEKEEASGRKLDKATRDRLQRRREEQELAFKTQKANQAALAALGLPQKSWMLPASNNPTTQGDHEAAKKDKVSKKKSQSTRKISVRDILYYLETEPHLRKSALLYKSFLKQK